MVLERTSIPTADSPAPFVECDQFDLTQCRFLASRAVPFPQPLQAENLELRQQAGYWKSAYERARKREEKLKQEVERLEAEVKKFKRIAFGRKSEKGSNKKDKASGGKKGKSPKSRGQQPGNPGPPRRDTQHLCVEEEFVELPEQECRCGSCGLPFESQETLSTEDSEQIEIEVKAHKRLLRRRRYKPTCDCPDLPGIITAPGEPKLIPKGLYGISIWVTILLDKYCFLRPTNRLLEDLRTHGLDLALGTVTGGLKKLEPLFEPILAEIVRKNLDEDQWHADETRWRVFVDIEGKVGHKWYLWLVRSRSAVVFLLDPSRAARVPATHFAGVSKGILIVDRYAAYKAMVLVKEGKILLAFCWVHVRRDFLGFAKDWSKHEAWGLSWVSAIGELYHLNKLRLQADSSQFKERDDALRDAIERMAKRRDEELSQEDLHPAKRKLLKSLDNHWSGLTIFVDHPEVPMDNNLGERTLRAAVCARKFFFGSYSLWAGQLAASMFSLCATLEIWKINPRLWMTAYFEACAEHGGKPPPDAARWLPWHLNDEQSQAMAALPKVNNSS
jgi:transposase